MDTNDYHELYYNHLGQQSHRLLVRKMLRVKLRTALYRCIPLRKKALLKLGCASVIVGLVGYKLIRWYQSATNT